MLRRLGYLAGKVLLSAAFGILVYLLFRVGGYISAAFTVHTPLWFTVQGWLATFFGCVTTGVAFTVVGGWDD